MREDRRPYWVKKTYLQFRRWYTRHYLHPACDYFGPYETCMKPWYISISGPNIRIGKCATVIAEPEGSVAQRYGEIAARIAVILAGIDRSGGPQITIE